MTSAPKTSSVLNRVPKRFTRFHRVMTSSGTLDGVALRCGSLVFVLSCALNAPYRSICSAHDNQAPRQSASPNE